MAKNTLIGIKHQQPEPQTRCVHRRCDYVDQSGIYCLKNKGGRGQRGKQKISPSGHLAPTIQMKNGRFYPRLNSSITEQERRAKLHNHPEDKPEWFVWLYQWKEKDRDNLWKTRSKNVPTNLIHSIKYMIHAEKSVPEILAFIVLNS